MIGRMLVLGLVLILGAAGCGPETMSQAAASELSDDVAAVRDAAETGDIDAAREALEELRAAVNEAQTAGELDESRADEILAAADEIESQLETMPEGALRDEELEELEEEVDDDDEDSGGTQASGGAGTGGNT